MMTLPALISLVTFVVLPTIFIIWKMRTSARFRLQKERNRRQGRTTMAFFHPYCNAGGGGERVLWCAIRNIQQRYSSVDCVVYSGDTDSNADQITAKVTERFGIHLKRPVEFVFLTKRRWVEADPYPVFTLIGQSIGSVILGWEAMSQFVPDIFVDSMGYAFTFPLFKCLGGCATVAYVHYPTVSEDMMVRVAERRPLAGGASSANSSVNVRGFLLRHVPVFAYVKVAYFRIFAYVYALAGAYCDRVAVNSSWTCNHIESLWEPLLGASVVYPPCGTAEFEKLPLEGGEDIGESVRTMRSSPSRAQREISGGCGGGRVNNVVSVAQFRPEKDHELQVRAFQRALEMELELEEEYAGGLKGKVVMSERLGNLVVIGSCRNEEDKGRVTALENLCEQLGVKERVEFRLNVPFTELMKALGSSRMGIHTMWNEHFGIGVVEMMAAGAVTIAHNSGGPRTDIVTVKPEDERTGYLADDVESYASSIMAALHLSPSDLRDLQLRARKSVSRFSEQAFDESFSRFIDPMIRRTIAAVPAVQHFH